MSSTLDELVSVDLLTSGPSGLALTELGTYVAQSGLRVSSAVRVAQVLRTLHPAHLNRATLIAAAQLTDELDEVRIRINKRGLAERTADLLYRTAPPPGGRADTRRAPGRA